MTEPTAETDDVDSNLIDLTGTSLATLPDLDEDLLGPILRRVRRRAQDPDSITSGYQPQRLD